MSNLEVLGSLERRVDLVVPMAAIEAEVQNRLKRLAKNVKAPGFRPGKVPMSQVAKMHGTGVRQEVLGESLQKSFYDAIDTHKLKVAGMPRFEPKAGTAADGEFSFSAIFEVYPEVNLGDLAATSVKRPTLSVAEENVDATLETLRKQRVEYAKVDRASETGDLAKFDFSGTLDGVPFEGGEAKDFSTVVGDGRMLKDFEDNMLGLSAGESRGFDMTFPASYPAAHLAGKTAHFEITMNEVQAPKLPEVDAKFAESLGIADGDVGKLRVEVRTNLEREVARRIKARVKEAVMEVLLTNARLEVPKSLVDMEIDRLRGQMLSDIEARGGKKISESQVSSDMFKDQAERRVKLGLIIAEVVQANDLGPQPEQVRALVDEYAQGYEDPQEVVQWYYEDPQRLQSVEALALEDNVVAWVVGKVQVTDEPIKFDELMGRAA